VIVSLADIPARGISVPLGAWAKAAAAEGLEGEVKAFEGEFLVTRHDVHIAVRGELHLVGEVACDRCGAPLLVSLGGDLSIVYSPVSTLPETVEDVDGLPHAPVEVELPVEDVGEYDGQKLDLAEVVREWATVERPFRLTCGELDPAEDAACQARFRSLAGTTGAPVVDPRFAILSTLTPVPED
jgi:uncharacterized metal-binding protein YceD (DUF177 family)